MVCFGIVFVKFLDIVQLLNIDWIGVFDVLGK